MRSVALLVLMVVSVACSGTDNKTPPVQLRQETHLLPTTSPGVWDTYILSCESGTPTDGGCDVNNAGVVINVNQRFNSGWWCSVSPGQVTGTKLHIWVDCTEPGNL